MQAFRNTAVPVPVGHAAASWGSEGVAVLEVLQTVEDAEDEVVQLLTYNLVREAVEQGAHRLDLSRGPATLLRALHVDPAFPYLPLPPAP